MQPEEKQLIYGLFKRLKQTEYSTGSRDPEAERQIQSFVQQQPAAPYYMAQSLLIQEAALTRLNQQIQQLQNDVTQLKTTRQPSGRSFLKGLFGGSRPQLAPQPSTQDLSPGYTSSRPSSNVLPGGSFMSNALQTAAGVAGGVVLGNMLTNMFHHVAPEEIVNIIDDPTTSITGANDQLLNQSFDSSDLETFNSISDRHFLNENNIPSNNEWVDDSFSDNDDGFL